MPGDAGYRINKGYRAFAGREDIFNQLLQFGYLGIIRVDLPKLESEQLADGGWHLAAQSHGNLLGAVLALGVTVKLDIGERSPAFVHQDIKQASAGEAEDILKHGRELEALHLQQLFYTVLLACSVLGERFQRAGMATKDLLVAVGHKAGLQEAVSV